MTDPTLEAYEAARTAAQNVYFDHVGQTVTHAGRLVDPYATAAVDAVWPIAEATVRAKVAAEIRNRPPISFPVDMRRAPYWNSLSGPYGNGYLEWCARIAEGTDHD